MSALSDYLENALLDHALGTSAYTMPTVYVALYTSAPGDAGGGTEVSGGSYARQQVTFGAASGGSASNASDIRFPTATADWGTVTHVGLHDAASGGNLLWHGALSASKTINNGDTASFPAGSLVVTLD